MLVTFDFDFQWTIILIYFYLIWFDFIVDFCCYFIFQVICWNISLFLFSFSFFFHPIKSANFSRKQTKPNQKQKQNNKKKFFFLCFFLSSSSFFLLRWIIRSTTPNVQPVVPINTLEYATHLDFTTNHTKLKSSNSQFISLTYCFILLIYFFVPAASTMTVQLESIQTSPST